ncbi:MAG: DUF3048 domain-containing protein [Chloroflexi bacterium]|nr:DUF3048 domain-containing protein [Chloroflexota bacterium]MCC6895850.1 DUF3048 domain-containing protein [Anaerolineae bacterium]
MKTRFRLFTTVFLAVLLARCIVPQGESLGSVSTLPTHLTTETPSAKIETTPTPDEFPPDVNPLTGLQVSDPSVLERRPQVVKISNAPLLVRPQAGIGAADIVFEHYAEGGLTRFSAIFYGQAPNRVGSIRSARLIDLDLMPMFGGLLDFSGASTGVETLLNNSDYANRLFKGVLFGLPYYWRDETIEVPHNMFMNPNAVWELASEQGINQRPDLHGLSFSETVPGNNTSVTTKIDIRYRATRVMWSYDAATGLYRRSADGQGHFDANTLEQITAANVVVIFADHQFTDIVESEFQGSKSYSIGINLMGDGDAVLFRDGLRYVGRWVRDDINTIIGLRTMTGDLLPLKPGQTWFQVMQLPEQRIPEEEWLEVE